MNTSEELVNLLVEAAIEVGKGQQISGCEMVPKWTNRLAIAKSHVLALLPADVEVVPGLKTEFVVSKPPPFDSEKDLPVGVLPDDTKLGSSPKLSECPNDFPGGALPGVEDTRRMNRKNLSVARRLENASIVPDDAKIISSFQGDDGPG